MTTLAIDAYGGAAGVCILQNGRVTFERVLNRGLTHSETLLPLVQEAFAATGLSPAGVDVYGITAGPGSFTGLRIGLSLVKGLSLPYNTPVAPVSTLEALAVGSGLRGSVVAALNARRSEVYWAAFACGEECERITQDAAQPVAQLRGTLAALPAPVHLVGDGAGICYTEFEGSFALAKAGEAGEKAALGAARLAEAMLLAGSAVPAAVANPEYLRLSQAERERLQRMNKGK